jgi:formylglycine-generating enzyme required for sulfatase activity
VYGTFAADTLDGYARLEERLAEACEPGATGDAKVALATKQAGIGLALLAMGKGEKVWPLLKHSPDPTLRSYLIERMAPGGVDPKLLTARLQEEKEVSVRRAILLSLGEYGLDRLSVAERQHHFPWLLQWYRNDPDPGIHGAAEWLVRQWQGADPLKEIDQGLASGKVEGKRQWYVIPQGQTMMVVANAGEFWMGEGNERHRRQIGRSFAIASKEVTVEQFRIFHREHEYFKDRSPSSDCPVVGVTWYEAVAYCNWLSEQQGIPKEQLCYLPNEAGRYEAGMKMAPDYLQRTGYRLPTEAEWEYACRAGAETAYSFGEPEDLFGKYAWYSGNSPSRSRPAGQLRPNDQGLFDMHGNAWEWTQDAYKAYGNPDGREVTSDKEDTSDINNQNSRVLRGGSFDSRASSGHSAYRRKLVPADRSYYLGFRLARTIFL